MRQRAEADDAEVCRQTLIQERLHHGLRRVACNLRTDQIAGIFVPIAVGVGVFVADRAFIRVAEKMEALPCAAGVMRVNMLHLAAAEDVGILCHGRGFVQHQNDVGVRRRGGDAAGFDFQGDIERIRIAVDRFCRFGQPDAAFRNLCRIRQIVPVFIINERRRVDDRRGGIIAVCR